MRDRTEFRDVFEDVSQLYKSDSARSGPFTVQPADEYRRVGWWPAARFNSEGAPHLPGLADVGWRVSGIRTTHISQQRRDVGHRAVHECLGCPTLTGFGRVGFFCDRHGPTSDEAGDKGIYPSYQVFPSGNAGYEKAGGERPAPSLSQLRNVSCVAETDAGRGVGSPSPPRQLFPALCVHNRTD